MIGRGGFATVYRAEWFDKIQYIDRSVALKLFHESNNYHKEFIREVILINCYINYIIHNLSYC